MQSMRLLRLQPLMMQPLSSRALAVTAARAPLLRTQATAFRAQQARGLKMQPTKPMMRPMPKEEHSAHTISQRLRTLKKTPPELIPLFVVVAFAVFAAGFALVRKLQTDKTLRLWRPEKKRSSHSAEH